MVNSRRYRKRGICLRGDQYQYFVCVWGLESRLFSLSSNGLHSFDVNLIAGGWHVFVGVESHATGSVD